MNFICFDLLFVLVHLAYDAENSLILRFKDAPEYLNEMPSCIVQFILQNLI